MLVLSGGQAESLFDLGLGLPVEVAELPADLAGLDRLLEDPGLLAPIAAVWDQAAISHGRPTIGMDRLVRLMVLKARSGWGYETLVREVADSLHLRRFCRISLTDRVPDESTIRNLVKRLGPVVVEEIVMAVIARATRPQDDPAQRRFVARAVRIDSTVVESDSAIRPISGSRRTRRGCSPLSREGPLTWLAATCRGYRSFSKRLRKLHRSIAGRTGQSKELALRLTGEAGDLAARSLGQARRSPQGQAPPAHRARHRRSDR